MKFRRKNVVILVLLLFILALGLFSVQYVLDNKYALLQKPVVQHFVHIYHSFRKIPDIVFMPYNLLTESKLERYELYISGDNVALSNEALDENPFDALMLEENKLWVNADFRAGNYVSRVKVRYRGNLGVHWNSYKKSYLIKFPKDNLFNGMRELNLIIPYDRKYFSTSLNNHRARKMNSLVADEFYVNLSVNGNEDGVMLASEHWSQEWVEKQPVSSLSKLYGFNDVGIIHNGDDAFSIYHQSGRESWKSWNSDSLDFPEADVLVELVEHATDDEFKALAPVLLDLDSFYAADALRVLASTYDIGNNGNNIVLLFDAGEGRFKDIPYNSSLNEPRTKAIGHAPYLQERIWGIPEFKEARDAFFNQYASNNKEDDMTFLDLWIKRMKPEFYKDHAKLQNTFMFLRELKKNKDYAHASLEASNDILVVNGKATEGRTGVQSFPASFNFLTDTIATKEEFLRKHPQFYTRDGNIVLPTGTHYFGSTVIVPKGTKLIVKHGARVYMGENASIISYSPVELIGLKNGLIKFLPAVPEKGWGVFGVVNTEEQKNRLDFTQFEGGGEATVNGVFFSGMVAFHNSDVDISNSEFKNARGDDGLNVKNATTLVTNNVFSQNSSDALDVDAIAVGSIISSNKFSNNQGDSIDTSFTEALVTENTIDGCLDKGISIGERSLVHILKNDISNCVVGVAVKDQSHAVIEGNRIAGNRTAVSLYQKKDVFGGATAELIGNTLEGNEEELRLDDVSKITKLPLSES